MEFILFCSDITILLHMFDGNMFSNIIESVTAIL